MNKKLIKLNHRTAIRMVIILAFIVTLAAAPLKKSGGDVQVRVENGNLVLRGDEQGNNIIITESGVSGRAGTTVNGERHLFIPEGVTNDIIINMKGGDDFVRVELPGTNFAIPQDLELNTGAGNDIIELLQVRAPNETRINTGNGNDIVFIDGVLGINEYIRSEFTGKFALESGSGEDLLEFHHTIFRSAVDVKLGSGIDGACNTEDSEFQIPDQARFNGGPLVGFQAMGSLHRVPSLQILRVSKTFLMIVPSWAVDFDRI